MDRIFGTFGKVDRYVRSNMPADWHGVSTFPQHMPTQKWCNIDKDPKVILHFHFS